MESPRVTPDFRQPSNGFESARSQSDGAVATIGKSPAKNSALDDMTDVKPGIMEMIQEERRVSPFLQNTYSGTFQKACHTNVTHRNLESRFGVYFRGEVA